MAAPIIKITKDPITLTIQKAKVVSGNFGNQIWCACIDAHGEEGTLYLPWASKEGAMSGVVQQFIRTGLIGPEDFTPDEGAYIELLHGHTFEFERVFKDGSQFINVKKVGGESPLKAAAVKELGLEEQQIVKTRDAAPYPTPKTAPAAPASRATPESLNALYDKALGHALNVVTQLAENGYEVSTADVLAATATLFIGYQKEGVK